MKSSNFITCQWDYSLFLFSGIIQQNILNLGQDSFIQRDLHEKNNVWEKSRFMNVTHYTVKINMLQYTAVDIQGYITNL